MEENSDIISINFKAFWQIIKKEMWLIFGITTVFAVLGILYAFRLKEEFVSQGKILSEVTGKGSGLGQYAGLAALAGVDIGVSSGASDAISPQLYPDVLQSTPYFLELFNLKINDKDDKEWVFKDYYIQKIQDGKVKPADLKLNFPRSNKYITLNKQSEQSIKDLKKRISCNFDKKSGVITISAKMPDPVIAANIAFYSMDYLTKYIIEYRTGKQKRSLDFLEERLSSAKGKYFSNQTKKASYTDQMPLSALRLQSADLQRERIESEYKISSTFYNTLLQKYEEAKLQMQQETPVIKVLEPPVVPNFRNSPNKPIILIGFSLVGLIFSIGFSMLRNKNYKLIFG